MSTSKVAISIDTSLLKRIDTMVSQNVFPNRSKAIQEAVAEKLERYEGDRLARECARLDIQEEQVLAEEGMAGEIETWPEY